MGGSFSVVHVIILIIIEELNTLWYIKYSGANVTVANVTVFYKILKRNQRVFRRGLPVLFRPFRDRDNSVLARLASLSLRCGAIAEQLIFELDR